MRQIILKTKGKKIKFWATPPFILGLCFGIHEIISIVNTDSSKISVVTSFIGSSIPEREILLNGYILTEVQEARLKLLNTFLYNTIGTIYYYENDLARKIKYIVESIIIKVVKGNAKTFSINLICPNSWFSDVNPIFLSLASWPNNLEFPLKKQEKGI